MKRHASFLLAASFVVGYAIAAGSVIKNVDVTVTTGGSSDEEFVGPFPNWINAHTGIRVDGTGGSVCTAADNTGATDASTAIQTCLALLGSSTPTVYFPAGTYKINHVVSIVGKTYVNVVGADPATTTILWGGNSATTNASFTGSIATSGTNLTLTVAAPPSGGTILPGQILHGAGISDGFAVISKQNSGTPGGAGSYRVAYGDTLTISAEAMTTTDESILYLNGTAYSIVDRLTFDGNSNAKTGIDQSWDNGTNTFDTGNQYADNVLQNFTGQAFRCAHAGYGCAEVSMLRDKYIANTIGISMRAFNALDMFVWYNTFTGNGIGVTNTLGAGNFHVYNSIFTNSTTVDVSMDNTGLFNFHNNYSSGSNRFISAALQGNTSTLIAAGNTILDTVQNDAIRVDNLGPMTVIDNVIRGKVGATPPAVDMEANSSSLFSMGNTFTVGTGTCAVTAPASSKGNCHEINDQIVSRSTINPAVPTLPGTPPNLGRTVYEATSLATIVSGIASAAGTCDNSAVHIQPGNYSITSTISIPANCRIQIIGDGGNSALLASGANPVLKLLGPSKVTLREFSVSGVNNTVDGIEINNADQVGSHIFMEQTDLAQNNTNMFVDSLDYTNVEAHDFYHKLSPSLNTSVVVTGGSSAAAGTWKGGATNLFCGASSNNNGASYGVTNGAHALIDTIWFEAGTPTSIVSASGLYTTITYSGSEVATTNPNIVLNNFQGTAALIDLQAQGNINITGTGTGSNILGVALVGPSTSFFSNTASPSGTIEFLNGYTTVGPAELSEVGCCDSTFLGTTLRQFRVTLPSLPAQLPSGITDVRMYRVYSSLADKGIWLH